MKKKLNGLWTNMKKIINNFCISLKKILKKLLSKILSFFKKVFSNKRNILIMIISLIVILIIVSIIVINNHRHKKFVLNHIYEVMPYEVRELYSNIVSVSCYGDLHFDIDVDNGKKNLEEMNKNDVLDYTFSYLDKNDLLNNKIDESTIKKAEKRLFPKSVNLLEGINNYGYGDYYYNNENGKIVRTERECTSDIKYVSHLYGYSYDENKLSMDVNVAYLKDGKLYNYNDEELGEYDGDQSKLPKLTKKTSYYRLIFVKRNGIYKLSSIEWKNRK